MRALSREPRRSTGVTYCHVCAVRLINAKIAAPSLLLAADALSGVLVSSDDEQVRHYWLATAGIQEPLAGLLCHCWSLLLLPHVTVKPKPCGRPSAGLDRDSSRRRAEPAD